MQSRVQFAQFATSGMHAGQGSCTTILQLDESDTECSAKIPTSPAACATAFPAVEAAGLLFVWMVPGADGLLQSSQCVSSVSTPTYPCFQVHYSEACSIVSCRYNTRMTKRPEMYFRDDALQVIVDYSSAHYVVLHVFCRLHAFQAWNRCLAAYMCCQHCFTAVCE